MSDTQVTVVVAVKDRREEMTRCLDAIAAQDHPSFEVVVIDNGSTDGTLEMLHERAQRGDLDLRVEQAEGRIGRLRNLGARLARSEIVAYTDSDCVPQPDWLTVGTAPFADPDVGVVTGATLPADPPPYGPWHATIDIREQTWRFETCNAFFRRGALLATPGFDERLTMWEDTAGGWGVVHAGYRPEFVPEAVVHHDVIYPGLGWHLRRVQRYGEGAAVVGRFPEVRRRVFWHPLFLRPADAELTAALIGLALAPRFRWAALLAVPYLRRRWPGSPHPKALWGSSKVALYDLMVLRGMVRESIRYRTLVL